MAVNRELIEDNVIVRYTLEKGSRQEFKTWYQLVLDDVQAWNPDEAYPALHDFRAVEALTPSLKHYTTEVSKQAVAQGLKGVYVAVLLKSRFAYFLGDIFLSRKLDRLGSGVHFRAFTDYDEAMSWLKTSAEALNKKAS